MTVTVVLPSRDNGVSLPESTIPALPAEIFDGVTDVYDYIADSIETYNGFRLPNVESGAYGIVGTQIVLPDGCFVDGNNFACPLMMKSSFGTASLFINEHTNPTNEGGMDRITMIGLRLLGNSDAQTGSAASGEASLIEMLAIKDSYFDVITDDCFSDGVYLSSATGDASIVPLRNYFRVRGRGAGRNIMSHICGRGTRYDIVAVGYQLHGFDMEPNSASQVSDNCIGRVYGASGGGGYAPSITSYVAAIDGGNAALGRQTIEVQADGSIVGGALGFRGVPSIDATVQSRGTTGSAISGLDGGIVASFGIIRGLIDISTDGAGGYVDRLGLNGGAAATSAVNTEGLRITTAASATAFNIQKGGASTHTDLSINFTGSASVQPGVELSGCTNVTMYSPRVVGASKSFVFDEQSGIATTGCVIHDPISNTPTQKAVEETGACDNNRVENLRLVTAANQTVSLVGAQSFVRYFALKGSASWTPGAVSAGASVTTTATISGIVAGAAYRWTLGGLAGMGALILSANATATDTVTLVLFNPTGSPITPTGGTVTITAERTV